MLYVHRSNHAEALAAVLADALRLDPIRDPMVAEQVAVQSRGMERWLSHQLAQRLGTRQGRDGICANVRFPFPAKVMHEVLRASLGGNGDTDSWSPDRLVWPILELLPRMRGEPSLAPVTSYLRGGSTVDRRAYGLARRVADLFDRYAMFRPQMVRRWSAGDVVGPDGRGLPEQQRWQPTLWHELQQRLGTAHPAERFTNTVAALQAGSVELEGLPQRISFFGTSALPPVYLDVLTQLARHIDVSFYVVAPSEVLWQRVADALPEHDAGSEGRRIEAVHPLLVSCAGLARDFQTVLVDRAGTFEGGGCFADPATSEGDVALLPRLQADLLADLDRGGPVPADEADDPAVSDTRPPPIRLGDDRSVQLHACHGPARQAEVLHDVLLHLFEDLPGLEPRDVLVMTPDIETYAPLITSVFGHGGTHDADRQRPAVPFRLADRTLRRTNPLASTLLAVLDLADGRAEASSILDLLGRPAVRERFRISEDAVGRIHSWVADSGVRWGIDADHRAAHGQPAERHHTWRRGLDRLLLGVAMADEDDRMFGDVVPYDDMESGAVELLDAFVSFCTSVFASFEELREPRSVAHWAGTLAGVVDRLMTATGTDGRHLDQLHGALNGFVDASRDRDGTPSTQLLDLDAVRTLLADAGSERGATAGYESGAVTFCAMVPMRSIPHRVVCLLGMDDGAFPRAVTPSGSDLLAAHPQLGDRDPRDEDRLLFLEAILAARDHLVVTYTGRDQRTNEERAPAVPIGELLDVIDRAVGPDDEGRPASRCITTEHPLQAFSPRSFSTTGPDGRRAVPSSFDVGQLAAAERVRSGAVERWRFLPDRLPDPDGEEVVELGDLRRFFRHPVQWLFTNRLGMWLREQDEQIDDTEPIETDALGSWALGHSLLSVRLDGGDEGRWAEARFARGAAPAGTLGRYELENIRPTVDEIIRRVHAHARSRVSDEHLEVTRLPIELAVGDRHLVGQVGQLRQGVFVQAQYSRLKAKHRLELWLLHLALSAAYPDAGLGAVLVGRGDSGKEVACVTFGDLSRQEALGHLATLIGLYRRGRCEALPLFETASAAYARQILHAESDGVSEEGAREAATKAARKAWTPNHQGWGGDAGDVHVTQCYGDDCEIETIIDETDFAELALTVWRPIIAAEVEL